jgi:hypothetical protein
MKISPQRGKRVFTNGACAYDCSTAPVCLWREKSGEEPFTQDLLN